MQQQTKLTWLRRHSRKARLVFAFFAMAALFFSPGPVLAAEALPEWRRIVEAKAAGFEEREANLMQARRLFTAQVLPELVRMGWGNVGEFRTDSDRSYGYYNQRGDKIPNSAVQISEALWNLAPFPSVLEEVMRGLGEQELSREMRLTRLNGVLGDITQAAEALRLEEDRGYNDLSELDKLAYWLIGEYGTYDRNYGKFIPASPENAALYREKFKFLSEWLPSLLASYADDAPTAHLAKMEKLGLPPFMPWGGDHGYSDSPAWNVQAAYYDRTSFATALHELWKMRGDKNAMAGAKKLMSAPNILPEQRWEYIAMTARYPGRSLDEYAKVGPMMSGIGSMDSCWASMSRSGKYGLSFGGCEGAAFDGLLADRHAAPRLPLAASPKAREAGIELKKLASAPTLAALKAAGPLYLVAESPWGPKFFDAEKEKHYRIFTRDALYYMSSGPRLYPLDLKKDAHVKLLNWYIEEGAAQGTHTLIASRAKPEDIVKSLESWYLVLWDDADTGPRLVLTFANSGNFMHFFFEHLGGQPAALFMGGIDAAWYLVLGREADGWHEARAARLPALAASPARPALVIPQELDRQFGQTYNEEHLLRQVIRLQADYPQNGLNRAQGAVFLSELNGRISACYPDVDGDSYIRSNIKKILWEVKGTPLEEELRAVLLIEGDRDDARKAVESAEKRLKEYREEQKKKAKEKADA